MTFDDYKFICSCNNINTDVIEACRAFVEQEAKSFGETGVANDDLGFTDGWSVLDIVVSKKGSLRLIAESIYMSTGDEYDALGRDMTKKRVKQLIKNLGKTLPRNVLKSYYLHYHDL
jgi:hypothetical protein